MLDGALNIVGCLLIMSMELIMPQHTSVNCRKEVIMFAIVMWQRGVISYYTTRGIRRKSDVTTATQKIRCHV
jgi:hypothetical protein